MSNVTAEKKKEKVKEIKPLKSKFAITILKDIEYVKLAAECRECKRLKFNMGSCGGREGLNICIAFLKRP
jgi:hypothetical protein